MADEGSKQSTVMGKAEEEDTSPMSVHCLVSEKRITSNNKKTDDRAKGSRDTVLWCALICALVYILTMNNNNNNNSDINNNAKEPVDTFIEKQQQHLQQQQQPKQKITPCQQILRLQPDHVSKLNSDVADVNVTVSLNEVQELRQKVAMYERLNKLLEFNSWMSQHGSKMRQNILILSSQYCGSSLLGEIFNQNSQVFYLYEPLKSLEYYRENRPQDVYDAMVSHLLDGIFHCKFDELSYFTNFMSFQYSSLKSRLASRALSTPPLCPDRKESRPFYIIRMCTPLKPQTTSAICKLHQHTVVKTIQFHDVHKLSYLMDKESAEYSLKVVHLVRDPRAIVYTHFLSLNNNTASEDEERVKKYSKNLCDKMLRNIKYAITAPQWLQGKYTLLRYEDLGTNPHQITELVYKFVGVPVAPQVRMWLDKLAYGVPPRRQQTGSSTSGSLEDFYAKNLTGSVHNWRIQLKYKTVRVIETECYEVMNLLGYKIVDDEEELTTLTLSLVD